MLDKYKKLVTGQRVRAVNTDLYNTQIDMVREWDARHSLSQQEIAVGENDRLRILNNSGDTLERFSIVGIGVPITTPAENLPEFRNKKGFYSASPSATQPFVILQEPLDDQAIGRALESGTTQCLISMSDADHEYAVPINGDYDKLASSASVGRAIIRWSDTLPAAAREDDAILTEGLIAPDDGDGENGDYYADTDAELWYLKSAGTWGTGTPFGEGVVLALVFLDMNALIGTEDTSIWCQCSIAAGTLTNDGGHQLSAARIAEGHYRITSTVTFATVDDFTWTFSVGDFDSLYEDLDARTTTTIDVYTNSGTDLTSFGIVFVPSSDGGEGGGDSDTGAPVVVQIRSGLVNGKYDAIIDPRDNSTELWTNVATPWTSPIVNVWVTDLATTTLQRWPLTVGDRYEGVLSGSEVGGPFLMSLTNGNVGNSLDDDTYWLPIVVLAIIGYPSQPTYVANIVSEVDIADGAQTIVAGSSPTNFTSTIDVSIVDDDSSITEGTVLIRGTDEFGNGLEETFDISGGGTATYTTAENFRTVTQVVVADLDGEVPGDDTIQVTITSYPVGSLRTYSGSVYIVTNPSGATSSPPSGDWTVVTPSDEGGYDDTTTYAAGDYVQEVRPLYAIRSENTWKSTYKTGNFSDVVQSFEIVYCDVSSGTPGGAQLGLGAGRIGDQIIIKLNKWDTTAANNYYLNIGGSSEGGVRIIGDLNAGASYGSMKPSLTFTYSSAGWYVSSSHNVVYNYTALSYVCLPYNQLSGTYAGLNFSYGLLVSAGGGPSAGQPATVWANCTVAAGTVTLEAGLHVASITDHSAGNYTVNFSITYPGAEAFTWSGSCTVDTDADPCHLYEVSRTASSLRVAVSTGKDVSRWGIQIVGGTVPGGGGGTGGGGGGGGGITGSPPTVTLDTDDMDYLTATLAIAGTGFDPIILNNSLTLSSGTATITAVTSTTATITFGTPPDNGPLMLTWTNSNGSSASTQVANVTGAVPTGIVFRWKLNEGTGDTANAVDVADGDVDAFDLTHVNPLGGSDWDADAPAGGIAGPGGSAAFQSVAANWFQLGATDQSISSMPIGNAARSVSLWCKITSYGGCAFSYGAAIGSTPQESFSIAFPNGSEVIIGENTEITADVPSSGWRHVVVTWDGYGSDANTVRYYVDAVQEYTADDCTDLTTPAMGRVLIGSHAGGAQKFDGLVKDVRIYDRVLIQEDIDVLFTPPACASVEFVTASSEYAVGTLSGSGLTELSISLWVKRAASGATKGIFQWSADGLSSATPAAYIDDAAGSIAWYVNNAYQTVPTVIADDTWVHLAITWDGSTFKSYVDGALTQTWGGSFIDTAATEVFLGNGYAGYWSGRITDFRVYNVELSGANITTIYNSGCPTATDGVAGKMLWWKMDEGSGTTLADSVGSADGTLTNGPTWETDCPCP